MIARTKKTTDEATSSFIRKTGETNMNRKMLFNNYLKEKKDLEYRNKNALHEMRLGESKNLYMTSFLKATELKI